MTSTDLCASHGGTEGCGFVEAVQGGEVDKTGVLCADESLVGNKTSETTCEGPNKRILLVSAAFKKYNNNAP